MKATRSLITLCLLLPLSLLAQQDEKAEKILERLSEKHQEQKTISAEFSSRMVNKKDGVNVKRSGKLKMKGDKFFLDIGEQKVFCNGKTRWVFLENDNEVQIKEAKDSAESSAIISPTDLFTIWEKDFKYKYSKRIQEDGRTYHVIDLYPENPGDKAFHTIELMIDNEKEEIHQVTVKGKQGNDYIYELEKLRMGIPIDKKTFVFHPSEHPGVEKIDLR